MRISYPAVVLCHLLWWFEAVSCFHSEILEFLMGHTTAAYTYCRLPTYSAGSFRSSCSISSTYATWWMAGNKYARDAYAFWNAFHHMINVPSRNDWFPRVYFDNMAAIQQV
jgi:hypothetical protein